MMPGGSCRRKPTCLARCAPWRGPRQSCCLPRWIACSGADAAPRNHRLHRTGKRCVALVEQSPHADARLSLVGDMRLLIHRQRKAFILYGIQGRSWIAWGDPVGEERAGRELAWDFRELM